MYARKEIISEIIGNTMLKDIIEKRLIPFTDYEYGFANLSGLLNEDLKQYSYGISIVKRLNNNIVNSIENGPTLEYYHHYREMNDEMNKLAVSICEELKKENINCINIAPTVLTTSDEFKPYLKNLRYKVSHKMIATRAGLGWIGKTDLFISNKYGPRVRLVSILIDRLVSIQKSPIDKSKCGACNLCVEKCPAQAASGILWDINTDRDIFFDAHKCMDKCSQLAKTLLNKESRICGICVSVCPIGKKGN